MEIDDQGRGTPSRRTFLSGSLATAGTAAAIPFIAADPDHAGPAQAAADDGPGHAPREQAPDRQLRDLLREIDPKRIEATVRTLASFGTRHTLSSQTDPVRGIGAARDWIYAQLLAYVPRSNGRLSVARQSFVQPPSSRIPTATTITNVVATLRGVSAPDRVYVVSGHYDSRVTDIMNFTADAPGADDDVSGVRAGHCKGEL